MQKYIIYCTKDQTKKAIELGAPIYPTCFNDNGIHQIFDEVNRCYYDIPTAEEMIGWLECQEDIAEIHIVRGIRYANWCWDGYDKHYASAFSSNMFYETRKEATIAAIDAALDYLNLINKKK